jgi:hypothetical protein
MTRKGQIFGGFLVGTLLALALVTSTEILRRRRIERLASEEEGGSEQ